jgi:hypothetical protein
MRITVLPLSSFQASKPSSHLPQSLALYTFI